jgi:hypothetical protein
MTVVLSVLIPTRNRPKELSSLIKILERVDPRGLEFIISDNSDLPLSISTVSSSIRFVRPSRVMNMTDHWNFLAAQAIGTYLTFVGDDDAIIPTELRRLVDFLVGRDEDLVWTPAAGYIWPASGKPASFFQKSYRNRQPLDLTLARKKVARLDAHMDIPLPYNRVVFKRKLAEKFISTIPDGRFYSSRIPDINAGVKILFLAASQCSYPFTVFISGTSPSSNGLLTRNEPNHPRAKEFNNANFNPLPESNDWLGTEVSPFGFMTFYEAINQSLLQLGRRHSRSEVAVAFRSVLLSSQPKIQLGVSIHIWPKFKHLLRLSFVIACVMRSPISVFSTRLLQYMCLVLEVVIGKSALVSIKGKGIASTSDLVRYLEENRVLQPSPSGFTIRRL